MANVKEEPYLALPCGKTVDDYIWWRHLSYHVGNGLMQYAIMQYYKQGPTYDEAEWEFSEMVNIISVKTSKTTEYIKHQIEQLYYDAQTWRGK